MSMSRHRGFDMLQPIDERGKLRPKFLVAYIAFTCFLLVLAVIQTASVGSAASLTWPPAGFSAWLLGTMLTGDGEARLGPKVSASVSSFVRCGRDRIWPMFRGGEA